MASRKRKIVAAVNDIVASSSKNNVIENSQKVRPKHQKLKTIDPSSPPKLARSFFEQDCEDLATALLGKKLVRKVDNGSLLEGYIVETEAYVGQEDKAAHSYKGKELREMKLCSWILDLFMCITSMACIRVSTSQVKVGVDSINDVHI